MKKQFTAQILFSILTMLAVLISFSYATFAWFSSSADTNVTPLEGGIGYGDGDLLISPSPDGPFSESCQLPESGGTMTLRPRSTDNLTSFYAAKRHNADGITTHFAPDEHFETSVLHGTVYLKSEHNANDIYLSTALETFSPATRWGLVFTTQSGKFTYIFRPSENAASDTPWTIEEPGCVVASVNADGRPVFVPDPSETTLGYFAQGLDTDSPAPGEKKLCTLAADEVARVDYYLYLEGCDRACTNAVQGTLADIELGFAGIVQNETPQ